MWPRGGGGLEGVSRSMVEEQVQGGVWKGRVLRSMVEDRRGTIKSAQSGAKGLEGCRRVALRSGAGEQYQDPPGL